MSKYYYKIEYYQNGAWVTLRHWSRPYYKTLQLDGSLDFGRIELNAQDKLNVKPFTPIRITEYSDSALTVPVEQTYYITQNMPRERVSTRKT